jgi:excisionase family DNA binding protein
VFAVSDSKAATPLRSQSPWLTADEAVEYTRLPSRRALYQAVRRGRFPVHRLGRHLRFHRGELDKVLHGDVGGRGLSNA